MQLLNLFNPVDLPKVADSLCQPIKMQIVQHCGLGKDNERPKESSEYHKEPNDKESLRALLVGLLDAKESVIYSDEVSFVLPPECKGPSGTLDLLVGIKATENDMFDGFVTITHDTTTATTLSGGALAETKGEGKALSRKVPSDGHALQAVVQPVVQILSVAQVCGNDPVLLFFGTHYRIRPFIYYKSVDILLTTRRDFQWKMVEGLDIGGTCAVALLLQNGVTFRLSVPTYMRSIEVPLTGFSSAMKEAGVTLCDAILQSAGIPQPPKKKKYSPTADSEDMLALYTDINTKLKEMEMRHVTERDP